MTNLLMIWLLQAPVVGLGVALDNDYVRVTRDSAPCASATVRGCRDRVIVALGNIDLRSGSSRRAMQRGDIAVFSSGESYQAPTTGHYLEVAFKPDHPAVPAPRERILPTKNVVLHDGARLFAFEERLAVGETRERHSHGLRVIIQLNKTRLQQWPDGEPELLRDIDTTGVAFSPPVIHRVKNVGDLPLRGIVIEIKPNGPMR